MKATLKLYMALPFIRSSQVAICDLFVFSPLFPKPKRPRISNCMASGRRIHVSVMFPFGYIGYMQKAEGAFHVVLDSLLGYRQAARNRRSHNGTQRYGWRWNVSFRLHQGNVLKNASILLLLCPRYWMGKGGKVE